MDAVPSLNEDKVRRAQQALQTKGFDPGPIDGIIGPRTEDAIRSFQDRYGIKTSAKLDNQTLYALGAAEFGRTGRWRAGSVLALNCRNYPSSATLLRSTPIPGASTSTTSPGLSTPRDLRWTPAPVGVPVQI